MIVVTGATGNVGRHLVPLLVERGERVAALTRRTDAGLPDGTQVVGDPSRPQDLGPVLQGATALFLNPAAVGPAVPELLSLARAGGVRRVVVLSALTVQYGGGEVRFADGFRRVEDQVRASGLPCTALQCADFDMNARALAGQIRAGDVVRGAYGAAASASIHERDIAEVGARALTDDTYAGQALVLTGPRVLTQPDKVALIGEALGRPLRWQEVPPEQVRAAMAAQGLPAEVADRMLGYLADCMRQPGPITDTVREVLGRPALDFAVWARDHAALFQGDRPAPTAGPI